jgi:hypothetical protein
VPLTSAQRNVIDNLDWLTEDDYFYRRSGRSYAQAVFYIRYAMRHPERRIRVRDHAGMVAGSSDVHRFLYQRIQQVVAEHNLPGFFWDRPPSLGGPSFHYEGFLVRDWWPQDEVIGEEPPTQVAQGGDYIEAVRQVEALAREAEEEVEVYRPSLWEHLDAV